MKKILALSCIFSLLSTTGCLVSGGGGGHGHGRGRGHGHGVKHSSSAVVVPAIVVPAVRVRVD